MLGYVVKSKTLPKYHGWLKTASQANIEKIDKVYLAAEKFPNTQGKHIINSLIPSELMEQMESMNYPLFHLEVPLSFFQIPQLN